MKNLLFSLIGFITISTNTFGQPFICGTPDISPTQTNQFNQTSNNQTNVDSSQKFVINVFFHLIKENDGTNYPASGGGNGWQFGEDEVLEAVKLLNINFNSHNIFFKYLGYDVINSTYLNGTNGIAPPHSAFIPYYKPNTFNISLVENLGPGVGGLAYIENTHVRCTYSGLIYHFDGTLIHEIGHCLGLYHIFQNAGTEYCEHVTRNPLDPNYNADIDGDAVADTPAQPNTSSWEFDENCTYIFNPDRVDCEGTPYQNIIPANFMGYVSNEEAECGFHFTEGQFQRMRNFLGSTLPFFGQQVFNTVRSLYSPFETTTFTTNIVSTSDNGNGTLKVCRNYHLGNYKFQPGFNYLFPENSGTDPTSASVNDIPLVQLPPFNCPVTILQISSTPVEVESICRGVLCVDEPFAYGIKYSTEVLGTMNITAEYLNEVQVKDPNLYDTLMSQYYHILKKYTSSGASIQEVIYKN